MTVARIYFRLTILCLAFFLLHGSFDVLVALQSSLHKALGTYALSINHAAGSISAFFLPTLAMGYMKKNNVMCLSALCYASFVIANFYPRSYTLLPASILHGCAANTLWTAGFIVTSDLADEYNIQTQQSGDQIATRFYGIFYMFISMAIFAGNAVSALAINSFSQNTQLVNNSLDGQNLENKNTTALGIISYSQCGIHTCEADRYEILTERHKFDTRFHMDKGILHSLLAGLIIVELIAAMIVWRCVVEEKENTDEKQKAPEETTGSKIMTNFLATVKLHVFDLKAKLLILYALNVGLAYAFFLSQVTRDWITCNFGIKQVGYGAAAYGIGCITGSCLVSGLSSIIPRYAIVLIRLILDITTRVLLIFWDPAMESSKWILLVTIGGFGITETSGRAIISTTYSLYFPTEKSVALSSVSLWACLAQAIAYAISTHICNSTYVILSLVLVGAGSSLYFMAEWVYKTSLYDDLK